MGGNESKCCAGRGSHDLPAYTTTSVLRPQSEGSILYVQKQDPSVKAIGYRPVWSTSKIRPGPRSDDIRVRSGVKVNPTDDRNNYRYPYNVDSLQSDAVNAFAVVDHVLAMYRRSLLRINHKTPLTWQWGKSPIQVFPRFDEERNACYSRNDRALVFSYFPEPDSPDNIVYTCQSFDVVAHEAGHAVLDALKPEYYMELAETGALHESFGDITAILALLAQLDMCETVIAVSKGKLHEATFFKALAEEFGQAMGSAIGLRNADNNLKIDEVTEEVHDLSRVFTGAFYDIMVDVFETTCDVDRFNPAETLYRVGQYMCDVITYAFIHAPDKDATFIDVKKAMLEAESKGVNKYILGVSTKVSYSCIFKKHFDIRKIGDPAAKPNLAPGSKFLGICGSLGLGEEETQKLKERIQELEAEYPEDSDEEGDEEEEKKEEEAKVGQNDTGNSRKEADEEKDEDEKEAEHLLKEDEEKEEE